MDKTMVKQLPRRPISGGTMNGRRLVRYSYWRSGHSDQAPNGVDFYITLAGEFHAKPNYLTGGHEYPEQTRLIYQIDGEAELLHQGRKTTLTNGNLIIVPPHHSFTYSGRQHVQHHWVSIAGVWPAVLGDKALQILPFPYDEAIDTAFVQLRETLILRRPGYQLRAISIFYELVARIEEVSGTSAPESAYPETVRNAIIFLRESYASPFSAAKTAAVVGLSASHLRALFEKWLGESPKRFHTRCRIDQAKRLLREQNLRVAEVAFHVGFRDAAHFSRIFKQVTGIAPNGYARQEQVSQPPRR